VQGGAETLVVLTFRARRRRGDRCVCG